MWGRPLGSRSWYKMKVIPVWLGIQTGQGSSFLTSGGLGSWLSCGRDLQVGQLALDRDMYCFPEAKESLTQEEGRGGGHFAALF